MASQYLGRIGEEVLGAKQDTFAEMEGEGG
jgi:hypothetical protein